MELKGEKHEKAFKQGILEDLVRTILSGGVSPDDTGVRVR
jgi:hypothetical protein